MNTQKAISLRESNDEQYHIGTLIITDTDTPQDVAERMKKAFEEHFDSEIIGEISFDIEANKGPQEIFFELTESGGASVAITIERTWFY